MEAKKNVTLYYGLIMTIYSISYVTMSAFSSVYLLDVGLSNGNVGILLAIGSLLSVLFQPVIGSLIDKSQRVSTKGTLLVMGAIVVITGCLLVTIPNKSVALSSVLYGICIFILMLAQPFFNALGVDAINYGYKMDLGLGRSLGSLGYAVGSYAFGVISVMVGPKSIPVAFSLAFFIVCVLLFFYPVKAEKNEAVIVGGKREDTTSENTFANSATHKGTTIESPLAFFATYKKFSAMLGALILVYFSHALINTFALQILVSKGGNSGHMGTASAIAAGCELVTAVLFTRYMKHFSLQSILRVSGIFFTLKTFFSFLVGSVGAFYLIQSFQMFGWGFMTVGIVYYVNEIVGEYDKAKGQAYAGMSYTIASVLATFLGGNMIDMMGVNNTLLMGSASAAVGTIILWVTTEKTKK